MSFYNIIVFYTLKYNIKRNIHMKNTVNKIKNYQVINDLYRSNWPKNTSASS